MERQAELSAGALPACLLALYFVASERVANRSARVLPEPAHARVKLMYIPVHLQAQEGGSEGQGVFVGTPGLNVGSVHATCKQRTTSLHRRSPARERRTGLVWLRIE